MVADLETAGFKVRDDRVQWGLSNLNAGGPGYWYIRAKCVGVPQ